MRNPCKECDYYHKENNTCQSKKCCTGGDGYITWIDRLFCKPYKYEADRKTDSNSEKPNNCEVKNYCDDCLYTDTCDDKAFFYACTSKATISKMEQVDEPKTQTETQNSNLTFEKADEPQTERSSE